MQWVRLKDRMDVSCKTCSSPGQSRGPLSDLTVRNVFVKRAGGSLQGSETPLLGKSDCAGPTVRTVARNQETRMQWEQADSAVQGQGWHLATQDKMVMVSTVDSTLSQSRKACLVLSHSTGCLITVSLEEKWLGSLLNPDLLCISRRVLHLLNRNLTRITKAE